MAAAVVNQLFDVPNQRSGKMPSPAVGRMSPSLGLPLSSHDHQHGGCCGVVDVNQIISINSVSLYRIT